jgi:hypothetical protein
MIRLLIKYVKEFKGASDDITKLISNINNEILNKGKISEKSSID